MYTKIIKSFVCLSIGLLVLTGCGNLRIIPGSGNLGTKSFPVTGFSHIVLGGVGELVIVQDGTEALSVETDDNLLQYVRPEIRGDTLHLSLVVPGFQTAKPSLLRFSLGVDDLASLEADGSWTITSRSLISDKVDFILTGANQFDLGSLTANDLSVRISGSARIKLAGSVTNQSINFVGGGVYDAGDLGSETTSFLSKGTGKITVWATRRLTGTQNSSGTVRYYGAPQTTFSMTGSGDFQSLGNK
jgi:hypothetical protein